MDPLSIGFIISAFIAGLVTFIAPCTLPLVPAYLGFLAGVSQEDFADPQKAPAARRRMIFRGVSFVLGFSLIFIAFGALAGLLGQSIAPWRDILSRVGGILIILFGLVALGVFNISFFTRERHINIPKPILEHPLGAFLAGGAFGIGWTPCVGPILGSILLLASTSSTAFTGAALLAVFSAGLAVPFLVVAFAFSRASKWISKAAHARWLGIVSGVFLIGLGLLLLTGQFALLISWGFEYFGFLEYDGILDLL